MPLLAAHQAAPCRHPAYLACLADDSYLADDCFLSHPTKNKHEEIPSCSKAAQKKIERQEARMLHRKDRVSRGDKLPNPSRNFDRPFHLPHWFLNICIRRLSSCKGPVATAAEASSRRRQRFSGRDYRDDDPHPHHHHHRIFLVHRDP